MPARALTIRRGKGHDCNMQEMPISIFMLGYDHHCFNATPAWPKLQTLNILIHCDDYLLNAFPVQVHTKSCSDACQQDQESDQTDQPSPKEARDEDSMKKCEDAEESTKEETEVQKSTERHESSHTDQEPSPDTNHHSGTSPLQNGATHSLNGR
jgi:hypothetical protein